MTATSHAEAAAQIGSLVEEEMEWMLERVSEPEQIEPLLGKMVELYARAEANKGS
ncbi:hypothetical protein [Planococcus glaciei]|nr:hypothetical protein [Planococcus glaciei]